MILLLYDPFLFNKFLLILEGIKNWKENKNIQNSRSNEFSKNAD